MRKFTIIIFLFGLVSCGQQTNREKTKKQQDILDSIAQATTSPRQEKKLIIHRTDTLYLTGQQIVATCYIDHIELKPKTFFEKDFDDFKVKVEKVNPSRLEYNSNPIARQYKTRITEQYLDGVNFAGHYSLAYWGCGSNCAMSAITDLKTGKVFKGPESENGIRFQPDSKLIVVNPPDSLGYYDGECIYCKPHYFVWDKNKLMEIKGE